MKQLLGSVVESDQCLVVAGGDGTVASLLDAIIGHQQAIPVAIMPLGTGNDLARAMGWGGGFSGDLAAWQRDLSQAQLRSLDRCRIQWDGGSRSWYNYCGVGMDARVALAFDSLRRQHAPVFRHRLINKAVYGLLGLTTQRGRMSLGSKHRAARSLVIANIELCRRHGIGSLGRSGRRPFFLFVFSGRTWTGFAHSWRSHATLCSAITRINRNSEAPLGVAGGWGTAAIACWKSTAECAGSRADVVTSACVQCAVRTRKGSQND